MSKYTDISKYFIESLGIRDNESRLYLIPLSKNQICGPRLSIMYLNSPSAKNKLILASTKSNQGLWWYVLQYQIRYSERPDQTARMHGFWHFGHVIGEKEADSCAFLWFVAFVLSYVACLCQKVRNLFSRTGNRGVPFRCSTELSGRHYNILHCLIENLKNSSGRLRDLFSYSLLFHATRHGSGATLDTKCHRVRKIYSRTGAWTRNLGLPIRSPTDWAICFFSWCQQ